MAGPAVPVAGSLPVCSLELGEQEVAYADGTRATIEVQVGSRSLLTSLLPGVGQGSTP